MGFELEYKINGRKVSAAEWHRHLRNQAGNLATDAIRKRVESHVCPVHGKRAKLKTKQRVGDKLDMKIEACCEQLLEKAKAAISS